LTSFFNSVGTVSEVRICKNEDGNSRGFGHIEFANSEEVKKAIAKAGSTIDGRTIKVDVAAKRNSNRDGGSRGGRGGRGAPRGGRGGSSLS